MATVLITGAAGQLGWELQRCIPQGWKVLAMDVDKLDITDAEQVMSVVASEKPDWIFNAAAYTAVDKAESDEERARAINATGARHLAEAAKAHGARLLQVSTDFVFDGTKSTPYTAEDPTNPVGLYGQTKLEGEQAVEEVLGNETLIVRTAWVYSMHANNFVKTMLRLMGERDKLGVVADQIGTPTWAAELARVLYLMAERDLRGIYNWTDAGVASWYDFAHAIHELALEQGLLETPVKLTPIPAAAYPTPAARPAFSVLDKDPLREAIGYTGMHWRDALKKMLKELKHG
ncbi:MAG: dTDP-4-dehydrorhamnose reductase [bacterium]